MQASLFIWLSLCVVGVECVYIYFNIIFSHLRDTVINTLAFKPPSKRGYLLASDGTFLLDHKLWPSVSVNKALSAHGLVCDHTFLSGKRGKRISSIYLRHTDSSVSVCVPRLLIIFSHGNSTDLGYMFTCYVNLCRCLDVDVFAYDYSGYGLSEGKVGEKNMYRDIEYVYDYVRNELDVSPENIILYGNSLGSAPSCYLASMPDKYPIGGLILDAPLASAIRLQLRNLSKTPRFDAFVNVEFLKAKDLYPTLIIHGTSDGVIPIDHAIELASIVECRHRDLLSSCSVDPGTFVSAPFSFRDSCIDLVKTPEDYLRTWWVSGAGHNNIQIDNSEAYIRTMKTFIELCRSWRCM
ncbi:Alpha/beta hydrolase domain-containing protein 17A [Babesia sp. Xinjiang]|uniref:Alpha/beta hydrolase domain-containing protein 17A n=1 Tax=Babesia sp. Xinjiang TaxID=462227 RepID=UPI000A24B7BF|nr:Alpha/beta hydrolase domain-containing protein 17A [Babesia sp. Xinjiang]ORM40093.1 Alpha/beta hydrolase domain-containing protein 17A [Babesia sp. Xinjiang]